MFHVYDWFAFMQGVSFTVAVYYVVKGIFNLGRWVGRDEAQEELKNRQLKAVLGSQMIRVLHWAVSSEVKQQVRREVIMEDYVKCDVADCDGNAWQVADMQYCHNHYLIYECDAPEEE